MHAFFEGKDDFDLTKIALAEFMDTALERIVICEEGRIIKQAEYDRTKTLTAFVRPNYEARTADQAAALHALVWTPALLADGEQGMNHFAKADAPIRGIHVLRC